MTMQWVAPKQITRHLAWILTVSAFVARCVYAESSPTALTVLASPISAAYAASHADDWSRLNIRGFAFDGMLDDVSADIWAVDGDASTQGESDRLLLEVRAANRTLIKSGVDASFIDAAFTTDRPYFSEAALWGYMEDRFAAAGQFCRLADLRGIAIRCNISNLFYQYQWDGYRYEGYTAEDLGYGAAEFGKRIAEAFLRECPNAAIVLIADDWRKGGPLWLRMLEGFVSALDGQPNASIQLMPLVSQDANTVDAFPAIIRDTTRIMKVRFTPENWRLWQDRGVVALGLRPLQRDQKTGAVNERCPIETYRTLLAAAKVFSPPYVWIDDPDACWWSISDDDAAKYAALFQKTRRPKSNGTPANLASYAAVSPLDTLTRIGAYSIGAAPAFVLNSEKGAAVLLWHGGQTTIRIANDQAPLRATDIATGVKKTFSLVRGASTVGPFPRPTLLEGLPVREYVLPASMSCELGDTPSPGAKSIPARYSFTNYTRFHLEGRLDALAPVGLSVVPPGQDFRLEPGERVSVEGALQGAAALGKPVAIKLSLALPGADPLTRAFEFASGPAPVWNSRTLGPVTAAPLVTPLGKSNEMGVFVCNAAGEALRFTTDGEIVWQKRFPSEFALPPVLGRFWNGAPHIAIADTQGKVRVLKPDGASRWEFSFDKPCSRSGALFANLHPFPGDELAAGLEDGRVCAVINDGFPYWTYAMDGRNALVAATPPGADGLAALAAACDSGQVVCLEHDGTPRWTAQAGAPIDCPPLFVDGAGHNAPAIVTVTRKGDVCMWNFSDGAPLLRSAAGLVKGPRFLVRAGTAPMDNLAYVLGDGASLIGLSGEFSVLWRTPLTTAPAESSNAGPKNHAATPDATLESFAPPAVAVTSRGHRILAPTRSGSIICLDGAGAVLWTDTSSAGPLMAAPQILQSGSSLSTHCVFGSTDGVLRCIAVD